jgi:TatD DNase family protein
LRLLVLQKVLVQEFLLFVVSLQVLAALVLETDAPDQPMAGEQGRRNEPAKLVRVAETLAEIRALPVIEVAAQTRLNAQRLFGLAA